MKSANKGKSYTKFTPEMKNILQARSLIVKQNLNYL